MNNYMVDNLVRQREKIDEMLRNYQTPMNVFNVGTQVDFEARMIAKDDKPSEIIVQRKTAFICLENAGYTNGQFVIQSCCNLNRRGVLGG